jgi:hypothetical protein
MFAAANHRFLNSMLRSFGPIGPVASLLAKCILFSSLGAMILNLLRTEIDKMRLHLETREMTKQELLGMKTNEF